MIVSMKAIGHGYHAIFVDGVRDERFLAMKADRTGRTEYWLYFDGAALTQSTSAHSSVQKFCSRPPT